MLLFILLALASPPGPSLVVVLYPQGSDGRPGNALADQGIRTAFAASGKRVEVVNEYLDLSCFPDEEQQRQLAYHLRRKYAGRNVGVVLAGLSTGLDFALKHRDDLFPGVPLVLLAVDEREVRVRKLPADVVGRPSRFDLAGSLGVALRLHPRTRRVVVVAGNAPFDVALEGEARLAFKSCGGACEVEYLSGLPMEEVLARVGRLPEDSLVYYLNIFRDGAGRAMVPAEALQALAEAANVPTYSHVDSFVGRGIVGGRVFRFEAAGRDAANVALRLLDGERPERIGVLATSEATPEFDWRQLRRWGISEAALPAGSVVRFKQFSLWDEYKWPILGAGVLCVVQTLLIAGLLIQRANRRLAEARVRQVIEAAPSGMLMVDGGGLIVLVNARIEALFGYSREEMLGRSVEMLVPERPGVFAVAPLRTPEMGKELSGRRKDGSEFPLEIGLNPVRSDAGVFALASVIDVSERHRTETELRVLTGRLLEAQESERRRIARELHDDLSQSLALLAVELNLLEQDLMPETFQQRVRALFAQARQISSSAHELSHRLHPSRLEQLGLVASLRGMCKEWSQAHGLPIRFTHDDVQAPLPEDVALCVYRIAQEAIRNVLRHSGAAACEVELRSEAGAVRLSVSDDGTGFDLRTAMSKGGLGLVSMRERLRLVGGEMVIDARPGSGTCVRVWVPVATAEGAG